MLKFILRLLLITFLIILLFIFISIWRGGDWIKLSAEFIYKTSQSAASLADRIYNSRKGVERCCDKVHKKIKGIFTKDEKTDRDK